MTAEPLPSSTRRRVPDPTTPAELGLPDEPLKAGSRDSAAAHVRAKLDHELRELLSREAGTRSGVDPEDLHQMWVALRRMRSVLKTSGALVGRGAEPVRAELGWLGQSLGEVRDYDVLIGHLRDVVATFDVRDQSAGRRLVSKFVAERSVARRRLTRALSSARYTALLHSVATLTKAPDSGTVVGTLAADIRKPLRRLEKAVRALPADPPDDDLHALRIHGKKLRYTAELARASAKKKQSARLTALVKATRTLQTILGEHQDAVVASDRVRTLLPTADPEVAFIAGRITEHELAKRAAARAAWPSAWSRVSAAARAAL
ncbi:MAG TPA: CHAD domain-containing protein [Amycolatopsis sp.]|nr:CHAD domain-containing protein [Amycolatopsis sp.]